MEIKELQSHAMAVIAEYKDFNERHGRKVWTKQDHIEGLVGDVADLLQAAMAKDGVRESDDADARFEHELGDCLFGVLVIAEEYGIDIEQAFGKTIAEVKARIE